MARKPYALRAVAVAVALAFGVAGCSTETDTEGTPSDPTPPPTTQAVPMEPAPPEAEPTTGPQAQPSATDPAGGTEGPVAGTGSSDEQMPDVKDLDDEVLIEAATGFIQARENQWSHHHTSPLDWLEEARPYVTDSYYEAQQERINPEGSAGSEWNIAHDQGLAVEARVSECGVNVASGVDDENSKTVQCAVTDIVVDQDGNQVPTTQIPLNWTRVGSQPVAMLLMVREGDKWLVDQDGTGLVS